MDDRYDPTRPKQPNDQLTWAVPGSVYKADADILRLFTRVARATHPDNGGLVFDCFLHPQVLDFLQTTPRPELLATLGRHNIFIHTFIRDIRVIRVSRVIYI